jgi:hypothetical protein
VTEAPEITGDATPGVELSASTVAWTPSGATATYELRTAFKRKAPRRPVSPAVPSIVTPAPSPLPLPVEPTATVSPVPTPAPHLPPPPARKPPPTPVPSAAPPPSGEFDTTGE